MIESQQFKDGLKSLEVLTFDEADRLVDFEYKDELTKILENLNLFSRSFFLKFRSA